MGTSRMTVKGQVTIPKALLDRLGLRPFFPLTDMTKRSHQRIPAPVGGEGRPLEGSRGGTITRQSHLEPSV